MQPENPGEGSMPVQIAPGGQSSGPADPAPGPAAPLSPAGRSRLRSWLTVTAMVLGLLGLAASAAGIAVQVLPRRFSAAQQQQIMAWESARRWRATSAAKIFPAAITYQLPSYALSGPAGLPLRARRVGIGRRAGCMPGADRAAAAVLSRHGCTALLRATYVDATGSLVVTVGVAVLPGAAATAASIRALPRHGAVRRPAIALPTADRRLRARTAAVVLRRRGGPYLIMSVVSYADDRPGLRCRPMLTRRTRWPSLANGVADAVSHARRAASTGLPDARMRSAAAFPAADRAHVNWRLSLGACWR
jgi:hypothetical protein